MWEGLAAGGQAFLAGNLLWEKENGWLWEAPVLHVTALALKLEEAHS